MQTEEHDPPDAASLAGDVFQLVLLAQPQLQLVVDGCLPHPIEAIVFAASSGVLGLAAGPLGALDAPLRQRLGGHPGELLLSVCTGAEMDVVFLAVGRISGEVDVFRYAPGPWLAALQDLARDVRGEGAASAWNAPTSVRIH